MGGGRRRRRRGWPAGGEPGGGSRGGPGGGPGSFCSRSLSHSANTDIDKFDRYEGTGVRGEEEDDTGVAGESRAGQLKTVEYGVPQLATAPLGPYVRQ